MLGRRILLKFLNDSLTPKIILGTIGIGILLYVVVEIIDSVLEKLR